MTTVPRGLHPSLSPEALLAAYARGWFPMDEVGARGAVGLYEADPRAVMPDRRLPRARARCAGPCGAGRTRSASTRPSTRWWPPARSDREGGVAHARAWARPTARCTALGLAHSVEAWSGGRLAGGLFGVALGRPLHLGVDVPPGAGRGQRGAGGRGRASWPSAGFALWDIQMTLAAHRALRRGRRSAPGRVPRRLAGGASRLRPRPARAQAPPRAGRPRRRTASAAADAEDRARSARAGPGSARGRRPAMVGSTSSVWKASKAGPNGTISPIAVRGRAPGSSAQRHQGQRRSSGPPAGRCASRGPAPRPAPRTPRTPGRPEAP